MDKSWEEIKDLLCLKICNLDIHSSVSHFLEIQQKDKESLAVYIHRFKMEAKRCNFTNNAATIQIFIKGLKNAHTLAAHAYKKGPQTPSRCHQWGRENSGSTAITCHMLPLSTVNVMSSEEDQCFQCQELGHIACHCPNIRCFECEEYSHIAADCPDTIMHTCSS